jgi:MOSC domain-containing protein YiiM
MTSHASLTGPQIGSAVLVGLQTGKVRTEGSSLAKESMNRRWTTAFYKLPIPGPVAIHALGLDGDEIADSKHHGGHDKAVLVYAFDHYETWRSELSPNDFLDNQSDPRALFDTLDPTPQADDAPVSRSLEQFGPGAFAENLCITGQTEATVCIGDRFRLGGDRADAVILEVSQPRQPCWKISRRWKHKTLTKLVGTTGRTGWYCRVIKEGVAHVGDPLTLLERPHPQWTVARANDLLMGRELDRYAVMELMALEQLSPSWKESLS